MQALPTSRRAPQNAACGVAHRRTRNCPSPHAEIAIAARGVCRRPSRAFRLGVTATDDAYARKASSSTNREEKDTSINANYTCLD